MSPDVDQVLTLIKIAEEVDGFPALNEAASLRLRHGSADSRSFVRSDREALIAYGQLDGDDPAEAGLVVHPDHRRRGLGTAVLTEMLTASPRLEIWAPHGTPAAAGLAARTGLTAVRELLIMKRPFTGPVEAADPPAGVTIRAFRPGADEDAWLAVNASAFAHHPEQGGLTRTDLDERMAEPWFDPAGFLLAERDGDVIGFHWTKQHPDRVGEVYVLGVSPPRPGVATVRGLGRALLAAGLAHLRTAGDTEVILYVDGTNTRAVELYERAGFTVASRDVQYAGVTEDPASVATMQATPAAASNVSTDSPQESA